MTDVGDGPVLQTPRTTVHRTEVDGVPVLWCEAPGPVRAQLLLRVGWADETLPTRGWTHLVEHLALAGLGRPGEHSNGRTDATTTTFHVEGDAEQVREFLADVTGRLARLPLDRVPTELGVLRSEEGRRGGSLLQQVLGRRHGAQGYGLSDFRELGLDVAPDPDLLQAWAHRHAATGNAVLWLSGPPPAGLRLHLPAGPHVPPPDPWHSVAGDLPAWFTGDDHTVAAHAVISRGYRAPALRHVVQARLVDTLRSQLSVAYSPAVDYSPVTGDAGWLLMTSDLVGGRQSEGVGPFLGVLEALAGDDGSAGAVTEEDLEGVRRAYRRGLEEPYAWVGDITPLAWNVLFRRDPADHDDLETVTVADVREAAREAADGLLAMVPRGLGTYRGRWSAAVTGTVDPVEGVAHRGLGTAQVLVVSPDGLTLRRGEGPPDAWTVRVPTTAGVLRWPDGRRTLVGEDGVQVTVEPTLWEGGPALVQQVDAMFPADRVVPMGPRPPGQVPVPPSARPGPPPGSRPAPERQVEVRPSRWSGFVGARPAAALGVVVLGCLLGLTVVAGLVVAADLHLAVLTGAVGLAVYAVVRFARTHLTRTAGPTPGHRPG